MGVHTPTPEQTTITSGVFEGCHHKSLGVLTLAVASFAGTLTNYSCLFPAAGESEVQVQRRDAALMAADVRRLRNPNSLLLVDLKGRLTAKRATGVEEAGFYC